MFLDSDTNRLVNHIAHNITEKQELRRDGSPVPSAQHYFRKALEEYTHDFDSPDNKISDPIEAR